MSNFWAKLHEDLPRGVTGKRDAATAAEWMDFAELGQPQWRYKQGTRQILLGYGQDAQGTPVPVGIDDNRHIMTVAGSRAGKGRWLLIPNLLLYKGSALVLDPKGELAAITARRRQQMGQKVFIIDPFGESRAHLRDDLKPMLASFNPLDALDVTQERCIDDAATIAAGMIQVPPKGETHWAESAQTLVAGLLLLAACFPSADRRSLSVMRDLLTGSDSGLKAWTQKNLVAADLAIYKFMESVKDKAFGQIARAGSMLSDLADRERASIVSTARTQTAFLDSPEIRRVMGNSTFDLGNLRVGYKGTGQPVTVYLCLPASRMASHGRWLRIMINLALQAFERAPKLDPEPLPTLFILEELCTTIGYSKNLEQAAGLMAGYGIKLWSVIQDISQLEHHYEKSWETFVGNAGTLMFFGNNDTRTLRYISDKLGQRSLTVMVPNALTPSAVLAGQPKESEQARLEPLLSPTEVEHLVAREHERVLVLPAGKKGFVVRAADYLWAGRPAEDNPFGGMYDRHL